MLRFLLDFCPSGHSHTSSNSVEIKSVLLFLCLTRPLGLTFLNNKNGWNTSMCSSSTLAINRSTSVNYPSKKWNTTVPLLGQKSPLFFTKPQNFNNLLTNPLNPFMSVYHVCVSVCLKKLYPSRFAPLAVKKYRQPMRGCRYRGIRVWAKMDSNHRR